MDKKSKPSSWSWSVSPEELKEQVENYDTLKITKSYRGSIILIFGALLILSLVIGYFGVFSLSDVLLGLVVYIPILFFVYRGHRWAMVTLIILWTIDKGYALYLSSQSGGISYSAIIWWLAITPYIFKALKVENERRKNKGLTKSDEIHCIKCGSRQEGSSKFCTKCGTALVTANS